MTRHMPEGWALAPIKHLITYNDDVLLEHTDPERTLSYVDIGNVKHGIGITGFEETTFVSAPSRARRLVRDGDVIASTVRTYLRAITRIENPKGDLVVSTGFAVLRPGSLLHPRFFGYAMECELLIDEIVAHSTGVSYPAIAASDLVRLKIPFPDIHVQADISDFLDRETAEADALVAKYERLIELLEEKRVALITRVVTKGLDPGVPMKDSGIEWIGPVPEHWNVSPVRRIAKAVETGGTPPETDFSPDGMPWYTPGDFRIEIDLAESERHVIWNAASVRTFPRGSILVVGIGATLGKIGLPPSESSSNQQCNAIILYDDFNRRFLAYALVASYDEMRSRASSSTLPILNQSKTKALELPIPPRVEQELIAKRIDLCFAETGTLIENIKRAIALVQERRSALITAAVTGQIDVNTYRSTKQPAVEATA